MPTLAETIRQYTTRYRTAVLGRGLVWLFLIAAGSFVLWWGLRQWFPDPRISNLIPCALAGAGVGFTYWWMARHWITHRQSAASLDQSLGLHNRLVTLEEFAKTDPRPELYEQLEADAQRALDPDRVPVPQMLDRTSLVLALILLLLMVLPVRGISPLQQLASLSKQMQTKPEPPTPSPSQSAPEQDRQEQQQAQDQQESSGGGAQQQAQGDSQKDQSSEGEQSKGDQSKSDQAKADQQSGDQQNSQDNQSPSKGDKGKQQQAKGGESSDDRQSSGKQQGGQKSQQSGNQKGDGQQQQAQGGQGQTDGQSGQEKQQQQQQAQGGQGQGMSQPTAQQEALRAEIQQLLKEVSGELKDLQRQLAQVQAEPIPHPGTDTDPNLYEDATQLDPLTGTPVPIAVKPDAAETTNQRKAEGVGKAGNEVAPDAPAAQDEDAALSDTPVDERSTNRQVVPPEYRDVFDRLNRPEESPQ